MKKNKKGLDKFRYTAILRKKHIKKQEDVMIKELCQRCGQLSGDGSGLRSMASYRPKMTRSHQVCDDCFSDGNWWDFNQYRAFADGYTIEHMEHQLPEPEGASQKAADIAPISKRYLVNLKSIEEQSEAE